MTSNVIDISLALKEKMEKSVEKFTGEKISRYISIICTESGKLAITYSEDMNILELSGLVKFLNDEVIAMTSYSMEILEDVNLEDGDGDDDTRI